MEGRGAALRRSRFQFHEGPIKTRREHTTEELAASFNSMKVRLKQSNLQNRGRASLFQFHEGPIKTNRTFRTGGGHLCFNSMKVRLKPRCGGLPPRLVVCFNSMKVRLKLSQLPLFSPFQDCFNSMKVRLKRPSVPSLPGAPSCFNSMKVRLKPVSGCEASCFVTTFQFHEGPIKTHLVFRNVGREHVSIP